MSLTKVAYSMISGSPVSVLDFGAKGDGTTDDTAAFNSALAASTSVYVPTPSVGYLLKSKITVPTDTSLVGANKQTTKLLHGYNGTMFDLSAGASLSNLYIEGQGATYTGYGIYFSGTNGKQVVQNCRVINFSSACFYFEVGAGSASTFNNIETYQLNGSTGTGKIAIQISSTQQLSAVPRKFTQIETGGQCSFDFGGCNDTLVSNSFLSDLIYTSESRGVLVSNCRIANQTSLIIDGHNNTIVGCDIAPQITIASGSSADNIAIQGNSYNVLPIIDNSGNGRNLIDFASTSYTPTLTSGGTQPSLGNGTLTGSVSRAGDMVSIVINLTLGSTTSLGTGDLRFSLPTFAPNTRSQVQTPGTAMLLHSGTYYTAAIQVPDATQYATIIRDTSGSVTYNSPVVWASGDTMRLAFIYNV